MSPLEFFREMAAYDANCREQFDAQVAQVWHGLRLYAEMSKSGNLPGLDAVLARMRPETPEPKQMTAQVGAQLMTLSKALGIPLRPMSDEAKRAFVNVHGS
jgi:hypothetical protein